LKVDSGTKRRVHAQFNFHLSCNSFSLLVLSIGRRFFQRGKRLLRGFDFGVILVYLFVFLVTAKIPRSIRGPSAKIPRLMRELASHFFSISISSVSCAM
jgi:hypothetical protein